MSVMGTPSQMIEYFIVKALKKTDFWLGDFAVALIEMAVVHKRKGLSRIHHLEMNIHISSIYYSKAIIDLICHRSSN